MTRMHPCGDAIEEFGVAPFRHGAPTGKRIKTEMVRTLHATYLQMQRAFPGVKKISEGETTVGVNKGYEMRFERALDYYGGPEGATVWMRIVLVPGGARQRKGVTLIMTATSLSPDFKSAKDVGAKGDLPVILNSFRLGTAVR